CKVYFTLCNRPSITQTGIDGFDELVALLLMRQVVSTTLNGYFPEVGTTNQALTLLPPEVITTLDVAWNEEDSDRNLPLACEDKGMRIVVVIAIVKGQYQGGTLVAYLLCSL